MSNFTKDPKGSERGDLHQDTLAARYAVDTDEAHGAVIPPLYMSSNFSFHGFGEKREYDYTRSGNPTRDQLADALAALEGGTGGVITASGMSAVHLATQLVEPGRTDRRPARLLRWLSPPVHRRCEERPVRARVAAAVGDGALGGENPAN